MSSRLSRADHPERSIARIRKFRLGSRKAATRRSSVMTRRIRIAVLGSGNIARFHTNALRAHPDEAEVVAAADVDGDRLAAFCEERGIAGRYGSVAELDQISTAERRGNACFVAVFQHRFASSARHVKALVDAGSFGRPLVAICNTLWYRDQAYFDPPWRGRWDTEGGGPTIGHGIHQIDLLAYLLGEWTGISAIAARLDREVMTEDMSLAHVRFANGAVAAIVNSVLSPRQETYLRFDFTDATVELTHLYGYGSGDWRLTPAPATPRERVRLWRFPEPDLPSGHAAQIAD